MRSRLLMVLVVLSISGCAAFKPPERSSSSVMTAGKLGYVADLTRTPTHTHLGTTVFNNFTETYERRWDLEAVFRQALEHQLESRGIELVVMDPSDLPSFPFRIFETKDDQWEYTDGAELDVQRLVDAFDLDALLQMYSMDRVLVARECSNFGCTERIAEGMGLYTRGVFGLHRYYAVPAVELRLELFDPGYELSRYEPLVDFRTVDGRSIQLKEIDKADDLKALSDDQLIPVKEAIEKYMEELARAVVMTLTVADPRQLDD